MDSHGSLDAYPSYSAAKITISRPRNWTKQKHTESHTNIHAQIIKVEKYKIEYSKNKIYTVPAYTGRFQIRVSVTVLVIF